MRSYVNESKNYPIHFVNAFDELNDNYRNLFNLSHIDKFLSFADKKNICIVNKSTQNNFLYYLIANVCLYYNKNENKERHKTIMVDAGNGNNLQYLYLNIINRVSADDDALFNIDDILNSIIIARAFTFCQLANIIIEEIPKLIQKLDGKLQIIILDLLNTLFPSSPSSSYLNKKIDYKESERFIYNSDFKYKIKLLEEMIDRLIQISSRNFVILSYNTNNKLLENKNIISKFKNVIEINNPYNKNIEKIKNDNGLLTQIKIKSKNNNNNNNRTISIKERCSPHNKSKIMEIM
ncbi:MAG: hypothetical protein ABJB76_09850 [Candidatus Nitrosocosmicus sp.]